MTEEAVAVPAPAPDPVSFRVGYDPQAGTIVVVFDRALQTLALTPEGASVLVQHIATAAAQLSARASKIIVAQKPVTAAVREALNGARRPT